MYPTKDTPYYGIFVSEQIAALKRIYKNLEFDVYNIRGDVSKMEYLRSMNAIYNKVSKGGYDVVHVHYGLSGLFLLNPFRKLRIPVVLTLHGGDIQSEQGKNIQVFFTKKILKHVNHVIILNERMNTIAKKYCKKSSIIPCSVNTDFFTPLPSKNYTGNKKRKSLIFPSAHNRMVKNYPLFLDTIKIMKDKYDIECVETELNNMSREEIAALYRTADAMLMTSISEGSPQVVKEAMACNLPVVATKVGDVDVLLDGVANSGWVYPHDANLLAEKLYASLQGEIKGVLPRDKILGLGLDDNTVATKIYNIYRRLIDKKYPV